MFDLAWTEIALIAVVAVVVIGPKDLPDAVRGVARGIQKLRRMAGEFQGHLDEVVREAKLEDVRDQIRDIRSFDLKSTIEKAVDEDGSITRTFRDDPFRAPPPPTSDAAPAAGTEAALPDSPPPMDATTPGAEVTASAGAPDPAPTAPEAFGPGAGPETVASGPDPVANPSPPAGVDTPAESPTRPATHTA
ncbi:twin-arginine translocase subunit TatB [Roseomonas sp. SSH11]|uniref:Sec-independent protein translocase protein TatB n=1 Tax=Pararoseomonas baculiformis TaxID=2820812 RepID=A0ABS4AAE6_9PROT|nr:Sec-independent protein translocase protein TatB [Pararoseomonas baculiformis]MBP0443968.1 twin-arginine translocase subunit TatB [Pararoseomonas baculiformis]